MTAHTHRLLLLLVFTAASFPAAGQKANEPKFKPALAYGGAPSCPSHEGTRTRRSEIASMGRVHASIVGVSARAPKEGCSFKAEVDSKDATAHRVRLPSPGKQAFAIVDFSPDGSKLLIYSDRGLEYPNENFRNIEVATIPISAGQIRWINVWDLFGWRECDATVEPQGFAPDGKVILLVRPSIMASPRRPHCVKAPALYQTDLVSPVIPLPADTNVKRYGRKTAEASQACKSDPDIVGQCFTVHGRLSAWNGTPSMRIWRIGTNRILGAREDIMPDYLTAHMGWDVEAYGDFEVCPFTKLRAGAMQMVCVESADHVLYKNLAP